MLGCSPAAPSADAAPVGPCLLSAARARASDAARTLLQTAKGMFRLLGSDPRRLTQEHPLRDPRSAPGRGLAGAGGVVARSSGQPLLLRGGPLRIP